MKFTICILLLLITCTNYAQVTNQGASKFKQLYEELPTPTTYRNAAGAPGHEYWQQKADYDMKIEIDDKNQKILGEESITYYNNSPDELTYLWVQLDQNVRALDGDKSKISTDRVYKEIPYKQIKSRWHNDFDGGFKITEVSNKKGEALKHTINKTMMRIDLEEWISMDLDGFGWIWMDLDGFGWILTDLDGFGWILINSQWF